MTRPSDISLNSVTYPLLQGANSFRVVYESTVQQQPDIAGSSRPAKTARPDILTWRIDDWSRGEGQQRINTKIEDTFRLYFKSNGAVDVTTPGQLSLGFALSDDTAGLSTVTQGPYLAVTNGYLVAAATDSGVAQRNRRKNLSTGTWSAATTAIANTAQVAGQIRAIGTKIYLAYRSTGGKIMQYDPSANTEVTFADAVGESPLAADSRLYFAFDASGTNSALQLKRLELDGTAPITPTLVYSVKGTASEAGVAANGPKIYIASTHTNENVTLHVYDGSAGKEFMSLPDGFRMNTTPYQGLITFGTLIFAGGWIEGETGRPDTPALVYATDETNGMVGIIREGTEDQITTLFHGTRNKVLCGTKNGKVYAYDVANGGISEYLSGVPDTDRVTSIAFANGRYFVATKVDSNSSAAATVYTTTSNGTGKYPSSVTVEQSIWDFELADEEKLLTEVEIHTDTLASGASVEVTLELDDATAITTDASGATLAHTSGTRTKWTISGPSVERIFRYLKPNIILKTSNTANTPVVYSLTIKATTTGKAKFIRCRVDLSDSESGARRVNGKSVSGAYLADTLEDLIDDTANRVVAFVPYYFEAQAPKPRSGTTYNVIVEQADIHLDQPGKGHADLLLRVL